MRSITTFSSSRLIVNIEAGLLSVLMRRQAADLHHRPNLDGPEACAWNPSGDVDRLVEIPGVDEEVAAQLFPRLGERTVGHEPFAFAHPDAGRRRNGVQGGGREIPPGRPDLVHQLRGLLATLLLLGLIRGLLVTVDQQHVFHLGASTLAAAAASYSSWRHHHSYRGVCGHPGGESSQSSCRPSGVRSSRLKSIRSLSAPRAVVK